MIVTIPTDKSKIPSQYHGRKSGNDSKKILLTKKVAPKEHTLMPNVPKINHLFILILEDISFIKVNNLGLF